MSNLKVTVQEIKDLMEKLSQTGLGSLEISDENFKLILSAKEEKVVYSTPSIVETPISNSYDTQSFQQQDSVIVEKDKGNEVKAPIVGTFYSAPSPDKEDFVKVGDKVKKGDTLFIIESMKLMNEIQSEFDGEVVEICVDNASAVEFDQTIMIIK